MVLTYFAASMWQEKIYDQALTKKDIDRFMSVIEHGKQIGMSLMDIEEGFLSFELAYDDKLIGNPLTGVIHGGAVSAFMDQACGCAAIYSIWPKFELMPTIDLRIDYMKAALPHHSVYARVQAYKISKRVVFTRGIAYQSIEGEQEVIAHVVANYCRLDIPATQKGFAAKGGD